MTKRKSRERDGKNSHQPFVLADTDVKPIAYPKSAPPPIGCPLNDEGTQRIIDKVGARFVPQGLKLDELRGDLLGCFLQWCSLTQLTSDKIARERIQRLALIARRAEEVLALLDDGLIGGWASQEVAMTFPLTEGGPVRKIAEFRTDQGQPDPAPSFNGFVAGLGRLAAAARHKAKYFSDKALYRLPRSPFEFFVANVLTKVFEVHFGRPMRKFSREPAGSKARGPYIRFAVAVLRELGITNNGKPYAPETIARAITDVRIGRVRRRKKKVA